jgi:acyl-[acyl-carrier-protein]-phospholipid O-acyltransferase / long-chain-fatty-acid--[acyl-carrier-protein] ligase
MTSPLQLWQRWFSGRIEPDVQGIHAIPAHGGALLLANALPRGAQARLKRAGLRAPRVLSLSMPDSDATATAALRAGELVLLTPRAEVIPPFSGNDLPRLEKIAADAHAPALAVWFEDEPSGVRAYVSPLIEAGALSPDSVFSAFFDLGERAISEREEFQTSLGFSILRALKSLSSEIIVTDGLLKRDLNGMVLLGLGVLLARRIQAETTRKRVGILLPPGAACTVANLGVVLSGKIPVNLNFTAGRAANESSIARSEMDLAITARAFDDKIKDRDFPYPKNRLDIADVLKSFPKWQIGLTGFAARFLPAQFLARQLGMSTLGGDREAVLLFTSGSSGMPKGVGLSHRNVLGNIRQIEHAFSPYGAHSVLACLPIFHSFGSTVTQFWPMLGGPRAVTWANPLDAGRLVELIEQHKIELVVTTPTFLRAMARKAKQEQFKSLKLVIAGAEKLPPDLRDSFVEKLGVQLFEGYGTTEASPVVSTNLPEKGDGVPRCKPGSVGRLMAGVNVTIRDIETGEPASLFKQGLINIRGANIFGGYLNDPEKTAEAMKDGWYNTGDLGRLDADGFLYVEGRLSRFSKIGGEMVPHGTVEDAVRRALALPADESPVSFVIVGVPDERKGESLVMLSIRPIDLDELRAKLKDEQLAELWIPKKIYTVEDIPLLGTGKLNLKECQKLARELSQKDA